ncbi:hypothetical protein [Streptomyces botrytidirepellens]|uniref:SH3b domain-containing protein n=1 Tax=Streptomyces botrytidirepellens TaxID=2486417 RepID=A0A3M8WFW6_9ACTN|nr:hypothetical protein [Streptomyces botrytidirepellens]RNG28320.1 hypothetical protein EEJ42_12250 [Streptomyces botrytidirepellens]
MKMPARVAATVSMALTLTAGGAVAAASANAATSASGCHISASAVNVRSKPSSSSSINGVAYRNWSCRHIDSAYAKGTYWDKVRIKKTGVSGWVRDDLVRTPDDDDHTCLPEYPCPGR